MATQGTFPNDHFSRMADRYAAYRPHYPPELLAALADRCQRRELAWDIGCGNGQLSVALSSRFDRVIATDPSSAQLALAQPAPRVEYRCETAEASSLGDASVDLAVAAQSAHWLDWPKFTVEVGRVVRPGGLVALISYRNAELAAEVGERLRQFYREIEPYWPSGRSHVFNDYRDLNLPWQTVEPPPIKLTVSWTRDELVGYISTWSATGRLIADRGEGPIEELRQRFAEVWPDNEPREVRWPLIIRLTRR